MEILALILSHRWSEEGREIAQDLISGEDTSLQQLVFKTSHENTEENLVPQRSLHGDITQEEHLEETAVSVSPLQGQFGSKMQAEIHSPDKVQAQDSSSHSHSWPGSQSDSQPHALKPSSQSDSQPHTLQPPSHSDSQPDSHSPSFGKESGNVMWCICGADKMDGDVVQCDRCGVWQHCHCAAYDCQKCSSFICVRCLIKKVGKEKERERERERERAKSTQTLPSVVQPLACGTTLVIVPESLLVQWMEEIDKHTEEDSLRVLHYHGVSFEYLNPVEIVTYNIVLVTYETLKLELYRVQFHDYSLMLRKRKKYSYPPSPLLAILWWRIVLDEAQVVESVTAKVWLALSVM